MGGWMDVLMYVCMYVNISIPAAPPSLGYPSALAAFDLTVDTALARWCAVCDYIICMYVCMYVHIYVRYGYENKNEYKYDGYMYVYVYMYMYEYE